MWNDSNIRREHTEDSGRKTRNIRLACLQPQSRYSCPTTLFCHSLVEQTVSLLSNCLGCSTDSEFGSVVLLCCTLWPQYPEFGSVRSVLLLVCFATAQVATSREPTRCIVSSEIEDLSH